MACRTCFQCNILIESNMKLKKAFRAIILPVILAVSSCSPKFFVQISDPQLGFFSNNKDFEKEKVLMDRIIKDVNRIRPDMVVFSGDLVHDRNNMSQLEGFEQMCKEIDSRIPIYYIPGNHDIGNDASHGEVLKFIERYGSDRFVHKGKGYTVIGFNSCVIKADTEYEEAEFAWLEENIRKAGSKNPVIVVAHHPFFIKSHDEKELYYNIKPDLRMKYLKMFEQYGVDLILSGHKHKRADGEYNGMVLFTAGAAGKPFKHGSGISVIEIKNGKPEVRYVKVDSFPIEINK